MSSASSLVISLAVEKVEGFSIVLSFLGIEMDTLLLVSRLPAEKVSALQDLLQSWSDKRLCRGRDWPPSSRYESGLPKPPISSPFNQSPSR